MNASSDCQAIVDVFGKYQNYINETTFSQCCTFPIGGVVATSNGGILEIACDGNGRITHLSSSILLPSISESLWALAELTNLGLFVNTTMEIPPSIGSLTKLQNLTLSSCIGSNEGFILPSSDYMCNKPTGFTKIPPELAKLKDLTILNLDYNLISDISVLSNINWSTSGNSTPQIASVKGNLIQNIPIGLWDDVLCQKLTLFVGDNCITYFPPKNTTCHYNPDSATSCDATNNPVFCNNSNNTDTYANNTVVAATSSCIYTCGNSIPEKCINSGLLPSPHSGANLATSIDKMSGILILLLCYIFMIM